jgi:hypothetical protein
MKRRSKLLHPCAPLKQHDWRNVLKALLDTAAPNNPDAKSQPRRDQGDGSSMPPGGKTTKDR